jgi:hypothetical protein
MFNTAMNSTGCATAVCLSLSAPRSTLRPLSQLTANAQTFAGIISLLNDYLISNGERSLGFLNPWLYGVGREGLNDIISGSNPGCGTRGFSAVAGWDPVRHARPS